MTCLEKHTGQRRYIAKTFLTLIVVVALLAGCAIPSQDNAWKTFYEQEKTSRQEQDAPIRNLEAQQRQQQSSPQPQRQQQEQPQQQRRLTRAETIEWCEKVEATKELPVGCSMIKLNDGTPFMSFAFANEQIMNEWWKSITETFAFEYCQQSNAMNISTGVVQRVIDLNKIRVWGCQAGKWSEWDYLPSENNRRQSPNSSRY
jgi:hypothetical protein